MMLLKEQKYSKAGCDMILIHSKSNDTKELLNFLINLKKVNILGL